MRIGTPEQILDILAGDLKICSRRDLFEYFIDSTFVDSTFAVVKKGADLRGRIP